MEEIKCWRCGAVMRRFASVGFYHFYKCPECEAEKAVEKDRDKVEGVQEDRHVEPEIRAI